MVERDRGSAERVSCPLLNNSSPAQQLTPIAGARRDRFSKASRRTSRLRRGRRAQARGNRNTPEGDAERAITRLERLDLARDVEADFLMARAEEQLGRPTDARSVAEVARACAFRDARAALAHAHTREGDAAAALDSPRTRCRLGATRRGDLDPHRPPLRRAHALRRGRSCFRRGPSSIPVLRISSRCARWSSRSSAKMRKRSRPSRLPPGAPPDDLRVAFSERRPRKQESADDPRGGASATSTARRSQASGSRPLIRTPPMSSDSIAAASSSHTRAKMIASFSEAIQRLAEASTPPFPSSRNRIDIQFDGGRRLRVGFLGASFARARRALLERWITGLIPRASSDSSTTRRRSPTGSRDASPPLPSIFTRARQSRDGRARARGRARRAGVSRGRHELDDLRASRPPACPVQCAGWGHPVTTGSAAIDHYSPAVRWRRA